MLEGYLPHLLGHHQAVMACGSSMISANGGHAVRPHGCEASVAASCKPLQASASLLLARLRRSLAGLLMTPPASQLNVFVQSDSFSLTFPHVFDYKSGLSMYRWSKSQNSGALAKIQIVGTCHLKSSAILGYH
jgi:hypothetical protein